MKEKPSPNAIQVAPTRPALVVVVEGMHDIEFLSHLSRALHATDPRIVDLESRTESGQLVVLPVGGSPLVAWSARLAGLGLPEFYLYDREMEPETTFRQRIVKTINARSDCFATLTNKRALENYLHPLAIECAGGPPIEITDDCCVAERVARRQFEARPGSPRWTALPRRSQRRLAQRTKRWLHRWVTPRMTPELLKERDPCGEVRGWLRRIASHFQQ